MKTHHVSGVRISGVSCAVPRQVVANDGARARAGKAVGVLERRHCVEQSLQELAYFSAFECMKSVQWHPSGVSALVFVTQTQPRRIPSASCELHHSLGMPSDALAFDVGLACSGYVYGLYVAASLRLPKVLLVVGDTISRLLDPADDSTYPIFGDAVSCTALERIPDHEFGGQHIAFTGGTDGRGAGSLLTGPSAKFPGDILKMDGPAVFQFAQTTVPPLVAEVTMNAYCDWYLFHQANKMMVEHIAKKSKLELEKVPFNLQKYGNTSSASIPLLMCDSSCSPELRSRKNRVAMFGFGAGYSWGGVLADIDSIPCSVVEV